jgi:hypothetical protein
MKQFLPQFSLRGLFVGLTLLALVIGLAANAPIAVGVSMIFVAPLLFIAFMAKRSGR